MALFNEIEWSDWNVQWAQRVNRSESDTLLRARLLHLFNSIYLIWRYFKAKFAITGRTLLVSRELSALIIHREYRRRNSPTFRYFIYPPILIFDWNSTLSSQQPLDLYNVSVCVTSCTFRFQSLRKSCWIQYPWLWRRCVYLHQLRLSLYYSRKKNRLFRTNVVFLYNYTHWNFILSNEKKPKVFYNIVILKIWVVIDRKIMRIIFIYRLHVQSFLFWNLPRLYITRVTV